MTSTFQSYHGTDSQSFEIRDEKSTTVIPLEEATWADWDKRGRLVYAKQGKLFTAEITDSGKFVPTELADFNLSKPRRTKSPEWARKW